nr:MAG TPA: hypothetical protein [Caudoviricetes sp.]
MQQFSKMSLRAEPQNGQDTLSFGIVFPHSGHFTEVIADTSSLKY